MTTRRRDVQRRFLAKRGWECIAVPMWKWTHYEINGFMSREEAFNIEYDKLSRSEKIAINRQLRRAV